MYTPGQLVAVSYDQNGKQLGVSRLVSAQEETILTASAEKEVLNADGEDLTFIDISITDKKGIRKMLQDQTVTVKVSGAGELLALGSANPVTEQSYLENNCITWYGNAGCYVRNNGEKGPINVEITSSGVEKKIVTFARPKAKFVMSLTIIDIGEIKIAGYKRGDNIGRLLILEFDDDE